MGGAAHKHGLNTDRSSLTPGDAADILPPASVRAKMIEDFYGDEPTLEGVQIVCATMGPHHGLSGPANEQSEEAF
jgi:hypothetical protein